MRTAPLDENSSIAVIDFRIANPSNILFEVRTVTVEMEDNQGKSYLGQSVSEMDAKRLFEALPVLGPKFNPTLIMRDRIGSHGSADRMIAARFQAPLSLLDALQFFRADFAVKLSGPGRDPGFDLESALSGARALREIEHG